MSPFSPEEYLKAWGKVIEKMTDGVVKSIVATRILPDGSNNRVWSLCPLTPSGRVAESTKDLIRVVSSVNGHFPCRLECPVTHEVQYIDGINMLTDFAAGFIHDRRLQERLDLLAAPCRLAQMHAEAVRDLQQPQQSDKTTQASGPQVPSTPSPFAATGAEMSPPVADHSHVQQVRLLPPKTLAELLWDKARLCNVLTDGRLQASVRHERQDAGKTEVYHFGTAGLREFTYTILFTVQKVEGQHYHVASTHHKIEFVCETLDQLSNIVDRIMTFPEIAAILRKQESAHLRESCGTGRR